MTGGSLFHLTLLRGLFGALCLAGCMTALASQARGADSAAIPHVPERAITITARTQPSAPNLFGTVALPVHADRYAVGWQRASLDASSSPAMQRLIAPARGLGRMDQIQYVQAAVAKRIRWISDATEWGSHDYWASARETLARGAGDAEDRAIVKMQALRALGVATNDLYLMIGKEKIGGPPITVLLIRVGQQFYLLDDWSGPAIPVERKRDFEPILSFSGTASWLHGRRFSQPAAIASARK